MSVEEFARLPFGNPGTFLGQLDPSLVKELGIDSAAMTEDRLRKVGEMIIGLTGTSKEAKEFAKIHKLSQQQIQECRRTWFIENKSVWHIMRKLGEEFVAHPKQICDAMLSALITRGLQNICERIIDGEPLDLGGLPKLPDNLSRIYLAALDCERAIACILVLAVTSFSRHLADGSESVTSPLSFQKAHTLLKNSIGALRQLLPDVRHELIAISTSESSVYDWLLTLATSTNDAIALATSETGKMIVASQFGELPVQDVAREPAMIMYFLIKLPITEFAGIHSRIQKEICDVSARQAAVAPPQAPTITAVDVSPHKPITTSTVLSTGLPVNLSTKPRDESFYPGVKAPNAHESAVAVLKAAIDGPQTVDLDFSAVAHAGYFSCLNAGLIHVTMEIWVTPSSGAYNSNDIRMLCSGTGPFMRELEAAVAQRFGWPHECSIGFHRRWKYCLTTVGQAAALSDDEAIRGVLSAARRQSPEPAFSLELIDVAGATVPAAPLDKAITSADAPIARATVDDESLGMLSAKDLATKHSIDHERLRKMLETWRTSNDDGYVSVDVRKRNSPRYLYSEKAVAQIIRKAQDSSDELPTKKNKPAKTRSK